MTREANKTMRLESKVAIVAGAGHDGLTAAAYLARAGLHTVVLERCDVGSAAPPAAASASSPSSATDAPHTRSVCMGPATAGLVLFSANRA